MAARDSAGLTIEGTDGGSIPPAAVSKLRHFVHLILPVSFGRDIKRWSLLSGVYAMRSKGYITCSGLAPSRERQL